MESLGTVTVDLSGHGIDYQFDVPSSDFFQLMVATGVTIEMIGIEKIEKKFKEVLEVVKSQYQSMPSLNWNSANKHGREFLTDCQSVAVLGAHLYGIGLKIYSKKLCMDISHFKGLSTPMPVGANSIPAEKLN